MYFFTKFIYNEYIRPYFFITRYSKKICSEPPKVEISLSCSLSLSLILAPRTMLNLLYNVILHTKLLKQINT